MSGQMITKIRTARFSIVVLFIFLSSLASVESAQFNKTPAAPTLIYSLIWVADWPIKIWAMTVDGQGNTYITGYTASPINPDTDYLVRIRYDGTNYIATINGVDQITLAPGGSVAGGSVGFKVKATTATFQSITVN